MSPRRLSDPLPPSRGHVKGVVPMLNSLSRPPRHAPLPIALRGAAYATGAGIVGLGFWLIQQSL
ncbi:hypothetical protein ACFUEM_32895 [Streptomyces anulatus]|uniref:hypothetical protein n=1 Tax=Streptomyces anulatus TaxID=1892 RepID=UPI0035E1AA05